jgi:hypothetical protein
MGKPLYLTRQMILRQNGKNKLKTCPGSDCIVDKFNSIEEYHGATEARKAGWLFTDKFSSDKKKGQWVCPDCVNAYEGKI